MYFSFKKYQQLLIPVAGYSTTKTASAGSILLSFRTAMLNTVLQKYSGPLEPDLFAASMKNKTGI